MTAPKALYKHPPAFVASIMRALLPLLVGLVVVGLAVPASAVQGGSPSTVPTEDRGRDDERDGDKSEDRGRSKDRRPAAIGSFDLAASARTVTGEFVSFSYNDASLTDFRVGGVKLFDLRVDGAAEDDAREPRVEGAQVKLRTKSLEARIHDNPAAMTKVETDGFVILAFPAGAVVTVADDERAEFTIGNVSGHVRGKALALAGTDLTSTDGVLVLLNRPQGDFDVHRGEISRAVARGDVGAEASFNKAGEDVEQDVVQYGNVTLTTVKAERGNLTLLVDGQGFDGRVLVLNVDGRVIGASQREDLQVLFDNETIQQADTLQDVLDPDDDGLDAEYYVVFDPAAQAFQMIVSVPHYSVHTLSVTTLIPLPAPSVVIGLVAGALLLVPSALLLFRRSRDGN